MLKFDFIFQITLTIFSTAWRNISYMYRWDTYLLNDTIFPLYTGMWRNLRRNSTPHILWYSSMYWCNLIKIRSLSALTESEMKVLILIRLLIMFWFYSKYIYKVHLILQYIRSVSIKYPYCEGDLLIQP